MKQLKLNEGGQPVYLDDLDTVQQLVLGHSVALINGLVGSDATDACYVSDVPTEIIKQGHDSFKEYIFGADMYVFAEGCIIMTTGVTFRRLTATPSDLFLHVTSQEGDTRMLRNGLTAPCSKTMIAEFTNVRQGDGEFYPVKDMRSLKDYLSDVVKLKVYNEVPWEDLTPYITFHNGYDGDVKKMSTVDIDRYLISISSKAGSWETYPGYAPGALQPVGRLLELNMFPNDRIGAAVFIGETPAFVKMTSDGFLDLRLYNDGMINDIPPSQCEINVVIDIPK